MKVALERGGEYSRQLQTTRSTGLYISPQCLITLNVPNLKVEASST